MSLIKKTIKKHGDIIILPLGFATGFLFTIYLEKLLFDHNNLYVYLLIGILLLIIEAAILVYPKLTLKKEKKTIVDNMLYSCLNFLFMTLDSREWSVCGMIQIPDGNVRRTPYYINESYNNAIRNHRKLDFGDIGKAFFSGTVRNPFLAKRISKTSWEKSPKNYRNQVPNNLRGIFASAIYSTNERDSSQIIGVLEFDIFSKDPNINELPKDLFDIINTAENKDALCKWASAIAVILEGI